MRRQEKIERFLKHNPGATERDLQKKFGLSRSEALQLLTVYRGESEALVSQHRIWRQLSFVWATDRNLLITLVLLALSVRIIYAFFLFREPLLLTPIHDAEYYLEWAKRIVAEGWLGDRIFFTEPFYAYFLALFLTLFGTIGPKVLIGFQFILGSLLPIGIYFLGQRLMSREAGVIAGILSALYGPMVFYEGLLLKTSVEIFLVPFFLLLLFAAFERKQKKLFLAAGLLLGLLALIKGNNMVFWPITLGLIFWLLKEITLRERVILSILFTLGVFFLLTPVGIRNYIVGHDIVPTNYSIGLVLYQGSWWGSDGSTAEVPRFLRPHPRYEEADAVGMAEAYLGRVLKPSEVSRFWMKKTALEIFAAPGHFFITLWNKLLIILNHSEFSDNYSYSFYRSYIPFLWVLPTFLLVSILALLGLVRFIPQVRSDHRKKIFFALFLGYVAVLLMTTVNARYRMPLLPFFFVLAGGTLAAWWGWWLERDSKKLWLEVIFFFMFLGIAIFPLKSVQYDTQANAYHALGYVALKLGDYPGAEGLFKKTIEIDPHYGWAYGNLMLVALAQGDYGNAEQYLKELILLRPDDLGNYDRLKLLRSLRDASPEEMKRQAEEYLARSDAPIYDANFNEGQRFLQTGDEERAIEYYRRSLEKNPDSIGTLIALASLEKKKGDLNTAREYLSRVLKINPDVFPARYNLANISIEEKNWSEVERLLKDIYDFTPELGETWYNYAVALIKSGKNAEAVPVVQEYIKHYENDPTKKETVEKFRAALKPSNSSLDALLKQQKQ